MSLIKFFLKNSLMVLGLTLLGAYGAYAQSGSSSAEVSPDETELSSVSSNWGVNISSVNWNDKLKIREGIQNETEFANYNGIILTLQREMNIRRWGYNIGLFLGVGQANGGGTSTVVTYNQPKVNFTMAGLSPRVFYRLSDKISTGVSALVFSRNISWPEGAGQTIDAGRNINATILADLNMRLFQKWDFYQGVGPLSEGATMWKLGITYRF